MSTAEVKGTMVEAAAVNPDNPWPGLFSFREADESYFQGRRTETEDLFRLVMRERLVILFGLSGLGKSSLLQAGLFPRVRRENLLPIYIRLDFSAAQPDLVAGIRNAISQQAAAADIEAPPFRADETLWEYFHRTDHDFWTRRNRPVLPLLVFDQFEEMFTLGRLDEARIRARDILIEQLSDLAEGRVPAQLKASIDAQPETARDFSFTRHYYKVLLSLREDFLPDLDALRVKMPALTLNRLRLRRMNGEAALLVVNQVPHLIDPDVAESVVRFVAADRRALPLAELEVEPALLSVVCRELNARRKARNEPKITAGLLVGSQEEVLKDFYEKSLSDLPREVRDFIEDHLLTVSGYRDSVALENAFNNPGVSSQSIKQLVERRLIRIEERGGVQRLELTHDLLTRVVRASRDRRRVLQAAERERQALIVSQKEQREAERARHMKWLVVGAVLVSLIFAATAWRAYLWGKEAEEARQAAADAQALAQVEKERAQTAFDSIKRGLLIRQAALTGNNQELAELVASLDSSGIQFRAKATSLGTRNSNNQEIHQFEMFPDKSALDNDQIAFITYLADHPTFRNTLMTAGSDRAFRVSYTGWGCLRQIVALIEYKDPEKPPSVARFDMCSLIGW